MVFDSVKIFLYINWKYASDSFPVRYKVLSKRQFRQLRIENCCTGFVNGWWIWGSFIRRGYQVTQLKGNTLAKIEMHLIFLRNWLRWGRGTAVRTMGTTLKTRFNQKLREEGNMLEKKIWITYLFWKFSYLIGKTQRSPPVKGEIFTSVHEHWKLLSATTRQIFAVFC